MKYVVIGASAAGISGIKELRRIDPNGKIVLISRDREIYSRCILHHYLSGIRTIKQLNFAEENFEQLYRVDWIRGIACVGVETKEKMVILEDGRKVSYDKLLIATGSKTLFPMLDKLSEARNVVGFRNIEDVEFLKEGAKRGKNFVVLGAGLVGMDCTCGLMDLGVNVTLVESERWLLGKYLDERSAKTYQEAFEKRGVKQYYGMEVSQVVINQKKEAKAILLKDGTVIGCDYLIAAVGVESNVEFLKGTGLGMSRAGLLFDVNGRTSDPYIFGAGDVSGSRPIWPAAVKEGIIAASNMAGRRIKLTDFFATKATMNYMGIATMSLGEANPAPGTCDVAIEEGETSYKKIAYRNGKIIGAILQGDLAYGGILQQLIANRIDVGRVKKPIFDIDYSDFFHMDGNFEFYYDE